VTLLFFFSFCCTGYISKLFSTNNSPHLPLSQPIRAEVLPPQQIAIHFSLKQSVRGRTDSPLTLWSLLELKLHSTQRLTS